jgi:hypothetical protein
MLRTTGNIPPPPVYALTACAGYKNVAQSSLLSGNRSGNTANFLKADSLQPKINQNQRKEILAMRYFDSDTTICETNVKRQRDERRA